jgi:hypothetical protein
MGNDKRARVVKNLSRKYLGFRRIAFAWVNCGASRAAHWSSMKNNP